MREHFIFGRPQRGDLDDEAALTLLREAQQRREALAALSLDRILGVLEEAGRRWADPAYPARQEVLRVIPEAMGFSREMVEVELGALTMALSRAYLTAKIQRELGSCEAVDMWQGGNGEPFRRALPRGVVLHVASGNAFTGGILSVIEGLVTKNVNLLKAASKAPFFPLAFARSLAEADPEGVVAGSLAILSWSGSASQVHRVFQQHCDAIVVWGAEEVVQTYREGLALKTHLIEYGPKVSFGAIAAERLEDPAMPLAAARSVALFDQNACSSLQVLYVEDPSPSGEPARAFAHRLGAALQAVQRELPQGPLSLQERAEVTKLRELARFEAAMGLGELLTPGSDPHWTVLYEEDPAFKLSPLFRTVYLKRVASLEEVPQHVAPYGDALQTVGLAAGSGRVMALAGKLLAAGALRVTELGEMGGGTPGEPHDGVMALAELVKWVSLGFAEAKERFDGVEWLGPRELAELDFGKRQRLIHEIAPLAPFHRDRLQGLRLVHPEDWQRVPIMGREDVAAHTPPQGKGLFTGEPDGGHFLRSGGSTASPKLSVFTYEDYEADMWRAARGAYAAGLRKGDRVANLFFSGGLYGSFLSVNRAIEIVGCNSFPFASTVAPDELPYFLRAYGIDTLMGLPSWLLRVFDALQTDGEGIHIRKVFYTGEHLYPSEQSYLRDTFGVETLASIGYGTVDAGPIGFQCPHCTGGVHHLHSDHQYVELLDRRLDSRGAEGFGEVLVTNLNRRLMPLVRYRIGDLGRWVEGPCPCGRELPRLELLGRTDDLLVLGSQIFLYRDFQQAAGAVSGLSSMIQLEARLEQQRDALKVAAELVGRNESLDREELARLLRAELVTVVPHLATALAEGFLSSFEVEVTLPGGLPRLERTGKVKRIIDRRSS